MPDCAEKASVIRTMNPKVIIEVDGGISDKTAAHARSCGIDAFVAGSYLFCPQLEERMSILQNLLK